MAKEKRKKGKLTGILRMPKGSDKILHFTVLVLVLFGSVMIVDINVGQTSVVVLDIFNSIMPGILSILLVFGMVRLIKKGYKPITLVFGILVISIVLAFFGIF